MEPDQASDSEQCDFPIPATSQTTKRKKRNVRRRTPTHVSCAPEVAEQGPVLYEESCLWARQFVAALLSAFPWAANALRECFNAGVLLVTDYSGIGTAEMCLAMIREALIHLQVIGPDADFRVWRVCDSELSCRRVLSSYQHHRPEHVLKNILDRLPCESLLKLQEMLSDYRSRFTRAKEEDVHADIGELSRRHGRGFMRAALEYMMGVQVKKKTFCTRHKAECDVFPPPECRAACGFLIVAAGWTCVPWSSMSRQTLKHWLHDCSLVFIAWLWSTLKEGPEMILGECVAGFDWVFLQEVLEMYGFDLTPIRLTPKTFGFPCDRRRLFMIITNRARVAFRVDMTQKLFTELFARRCVADARMFLRAPRSDIRRQLDKLAEQNFLPGASELEGGEWPFEVLLDRSRLKRLEGYERLALASNRGFFVADLNQNPAFWRRVLATAPALLRGSWPVAVVPKSKKRRPILMCEEFAIQGIPVLLPRNHFLTTMLPAKLRYSQLRASLHGTNSITEKEYRSMAGNGQHAACIGSCLLVALAALALHAEEEQE